jgi:hypothetical protein
MGFEPATTVTDGPGPHRYFIWRLAYSHETLKYDSWACKLVQWMNEWITQSMDSGFEPPGSSEQSYKLHSLLDTQSDYQILTKDSALYSYNDNLAKS